MGSFTQYPLRLAWAITIHKSQGLTFEKAIIDAGQAFAGGQVYVALSRCTNLEGMVLQSRVRRQSLSTDPRIKQFSENSRASGQLQQELSIARKNYQQQVLLSLFEFTSVEQSAGQLAQYIKGYSDSFNPGTIDWINEWMEMVTRLEETAAKFRTQLQNLFIQPLSPEENITAQERIKAAASYFSKEANNLIQILSQSPAVTDSKIHAKDYNEGIREVFSRLSSKKYLLDGCINGFTIEEYYARKKNFTLPSFTVNAYAASSSSQIKNESPHPALYYQLRKLRDSICSRKDLPIYMVASSKTLDEMVQYLPQTPDELEEITGFGKVKVEKYGQEFLDIIQQYSRENNLESKINEKESRSKSGTKTKRKEKEPKEPKSLKIDTKEQTFTLYKEGMPISGIAKTRTLSVQTIEKHLEYYISQGQISIEELVSADKLLLIENALEGYAEGSIIPIKDKLGDSISYGEIRMVIAWRSFSNH